MKVQSISDCDDVTKRYYHLIWILQPANKVVKDFVIFVTEKRFHEVCANISLYLLDKGLAYNGKNANRYYDFVTRDIDNEYRAYLKTSKK